MRKRLETRLRDDSGFTLIELLAAIVVLTVGVIALLGTFDSSRKLTLLSERQTSIAHRAQGELERLQAIPYTELAMYSTPPSHSSDSSNPDYYVDYSSPVKCKEVAAWGCYAWNASNTAEEAPLIKATAGECKEPVVEGCGVVSAAPTAWSDEHMSGDIYDFVTWEKDAVCEAKKLCPSTESYKRITVVVTIAQSGSGPTQPPVRLSTLMANPSAAPEGSVKNGVQNPLESPTTKCGTESCVNGIQRGNPQSWYLHDSSASSEPATPPSGSHATHATIAASGECASGKTTGCPHPDLMSATSPTTTTLYDYSTDQNAEGYTRGPTQYGGRLLRREAECTATPGNDGGEMWVTPVMGAATKLTGYGALSIYTQTLNNAAATVKLCVAVYNVPESITNLVEQPAARIGEVAEYGPVSWATSPAPVAPLTEYSPSNLSFVFTFLSKTQLEKLETVTVAEKHRIGLRIWPAATSTSAISIAYDTTGKTETLNGTTVETPGYSALVQLNTE